MYVGGAERWVADVVKATRTTVTWVGVGVLRGVFGQVFDEIVDTPIFQGEMGCRELGQKVDVLLVWTVKNALPYAARGIPVVAISHSPPESQWARDFFGDDGVIGATHYVGVSESAVKCLAEKDQEGAAIIGHGMDPDRVKPKVPREVQRERWGINPHSVVVGYTGRLSEEKRYHLVWQCLKHLPENYVAVLVGDGPFIIDDRKRAAEEAGDRVKLVGAVSDIADPLNAMDCLVMPSEYESFCYSIVEAWAAGVPVVATGVGVVNRYPDLVHRLRLHNPRPEEVAHKVLLSGLPWKPAVAKVTVEAAFSWKDFSENWTRYILAIHEEQCRRLQL